MRNSMKKITYLFALLAISCATTAGSYDDFFRAVISDNPGTVRSLIDRGFDPNTVNEKKQTGLILALREPSPKVAKVLIESPKTDVSAVNGSDESPLMMAALKGEQEFVTLLLARDAAVNKTGWAPLHYAATSGQLTIMKQLLDKSAFIDAQSPNGTTPLMMAASYGTPEAVKLLIEAGADIGMRNQKGMSALDFAQRAERQNSVELLQTALRWKLRGGAPRGQW